MSKEIESMEVSGIYRGVNLNLVRHRNAEEMRIEVDRRFLSQHSEKIKMALLEMAEKVHEKFAFTIGEYDNNHVPTIHVFVPMTIQNEDLNEVLAHEALHVVCGICRHELMSEMYSGLPVHISSDCHDINAIMEEPVAVMIGHVTRNLHSMCEAVKKESGRVEFVHGISL